MNKSFEEYYHEAIIKPQHEAYCARVQRITGNVIKWCIIISFSVIVIKELL